MSEQDASLRDVVDAIVGPLLQTLNLLIEVAEEIRDGVDKINRHLAEMNDESDP